MEYGQGLAQRLGLLLRTFRTILLIVLVFGIMWFVAMFVSGRPPVKPIITCVTAAITLGGVQVMLNTFIDVERLVLVARGVGRYLDAGPEFDQPRRRARRVEVCAVRWHLGAPHREPVPA